MKNQKQFFLSFLLMPVFFLTAATNSFAFSAPSLDLGSLQGDYFKTDQNRKAFLFEGNNTNVSFQNQSENEKEASYFYYHLSLSQQIDRFPQQTDFDSDFVVTKKRILKSQIFPFHFFW